MSVADLILVLHAIDAEPVIESVGEENCLNWGYLEDRHELIQRAVRMADAFLVDENGGRDASNEVALMLSGFNVRCLERDEFGWLTGGIETQKGLIAYG